MSISNRPQFWLQIKKDYIIDNFDNLIVYLSKYEYNQAEDNNDYDSTLSCLEELVEESSTIINNTPFFKHPDLPYDKTLVIRILGVYINAVFKAGRFPYKTIMTLVNLLIRDITSIDTESVIKIYDLLINCIRKRKLVSTGITWHDLSQSEINELVLTRKLAAIRFSDHTPDTPNYYIEGEGLFVIPPIGTPELCVINRQKYVNGRYEILFEMPRMVNVLTDKEDFEYSEDFFRLYNVMERLIKRQDNYKSVPVIMRSNYTYDDSFPVIITNKFGWKVEAESIDPKYNKLSGKVLLEMPPRRVRMKTISDMLKPGDIIQVYRSRKDGFTFEIYDAFEDFYRQYACGCAAQERMAIFCTAYGRGTEWITSDGMHIGIDSSKTAGLNEEDQEELHHAIEHRTPILLRLYYEAPDINKEEFNIYGEPVKFTVNLSETGGSLSIDDADRTMVRNFLEYSRSESDKFYGRASAEFVKTTEEDCAMLIPVMNLMCNNSQISSKSRLEYNTATAMLCKLTGHAKEQEYLIQNNRYLYELVRFASDRQVSPLAIDEEFSKDPESLEKERVVEILTQYKKKSVLKSTNFQVAAKRPDLVSKLEAMVHASNSLIDIIDESELNNIKQSIARMLKVEDEYISILDDRTYYGVESINLEFKASIVYPPYNKRRSPEDIIDPELQKWAVIKAVCGFLNSRSGGDLLIGVNDNGYACGIEDDIAELHRLKYISHPDADHYRLHVLRVLNKAFTVSEGYKEPSEISNSFIDAAVETNAEGKTILRVKVRPYTKGIIKLAAPATNRPTGIFDSYVRLSGRTVSITPGMVEEILKYK